MNFKISTFVICSVILSSCCHYPYRYSADEGTKSAKAVLGSPDQVEAYLGASFRQSKLTSAIKCPPEPVVEMAPVAPEEEGIIRFGAFAVRHGEKHHMATVFWWSLKGDLRKYTCTAEDHSKISFIWINERTIRFQWGKEAPASKVVRLNDDDGDPVTILR